MPPVEAGEDPFGGSAVGGPGVEADVEPLPADAVGPVLVTAYPTVLNASRARCTEPASMSTVVTSGEPSRWAMSAAL
ncbi:hypothetical protein BG844_15055 [Couchioplanes caeruleus subsp. caeruleus]|uniref:Uncharacterized protein n=1 Tax=Couchioplanes caeruleus subsp. caeruleus TaxID=56427 RepID=A0A1K0G878_9ACTN|nr:hypothetical protein [Couchioplanes caeruleus]OJF13458.1 hypothetical protein BG844_15055 [Couchioplanes caeruleus subsp. caeruleus]